MKSRPRLMLALTVINISLAVWTTAFQKHYLMGVCAAAADKAIETARMHPARGGAE